MPEDISPKQDSGVLKEITQAGEGSETPPKGCKVSVHYTGTLLDGTTFDSSRDRDSPFEFDLGKGSVIKAWDIGVATMKKGERAILTCASEYAYGKTGSPPNIPPDATLLFDVEVLGWKGVDISPNADEGIQKYQIVAGEGYVSPKDGALVEVNLKGYYGETVFDERSYVTFNLGEGSEVQVIEAIERCLEKMIKGEVARIAINSEYGFGTEGSAEFEVPPGTDIQYEISLLKFEQTKDTWSMGFEEKIEQSKIFKEKGTNYFKKSKYNLAIKMYKRVLLYLDKEEEDSSDEKKSLVLSSNLNLALCYLKLNNNVEAKNVATTALGLDPDNVKALFRRGQAYLNIKEPELASKDFQDVLKLEPDNKAAQSHLVTCNKILKEQLHREKQIYANMFDKFAKTDTQREEEERKKEPDVMSSLGEWGKEDREREPSDFERENPNILLLNSSGEFKNM